MTLDPAGIGADIAAIWLEPEEEVNRVQAVFLGEGLRLR